MKTRNFPPLSGLVPVLALGFVFLSRSLADEQIPIEVAPNGTSNTSAIFRNELTDVEVKDDQPKDATFEDLYNNTSKNGSSMSLRQQLGDQIVLEQSTQIAVQKNDGPPIGNDSSTSSYNTMAASWKPVSPLSFRLSSSSLQNLSAEQRTDSLMAETRKFEAKVQAASSTTVSLTDSTQRNFDYTTSAYDTYHTTGLTFSQLLGKSNVTWNATPSWEQDAVGGDYPSSQSGPQMSTSFDWKQSDATKWSLGGTWNQMEGMAAAVAQSTHQLFLSYNHDLSKNMKLLLRTDYQDQSSPATPATALADDQKISVQMGQRYSLSESLSAQVDFRHSIEQQTGEPKPISDSMATFSLQKSF